MNQSTLRKSLIGCSFIAIILLFGCSNSTETSNKTINKNNNQANMAETATTPLSVEDLATKTKIEEALKKAGFTDVKVDTTTMPFSIRGTVAGDKMAEVIFVAEQAAGKKLKNEIIEKK